MRVRFHCKDVSWGGVGGPRRSDLRIISLETHAATPGGEELWWSAWDREGFLLLEQRLDSCVSSASIRGAGANRRARLVTCLKAPPVVNSSARPHGRCVEVTSFIRESYRSGKAARWRKDINEDRSAKKRTITERIRSSWED